MFDLHSDDLTALLPALLAAKAAFKPAIKDADNPHFRTKFVSLASVNDAVDEALTANGLVVVQPLRIEDGRHVLVTMLMHKTGEWIGSEYKINPVKADPQGEGSALTYARRYAKMALLGLAPEDDDGNAASTASRNGYADSPYGDGEQSAAPEDTGLSVTEWSEVIKTAADPEVLTKVGEDLAASSLSPAARKPLKEQWSARMKELKAATP